MIQDLQQAEANHRGRFAGLRTTDHRQL